MRNNTTWFYFLVIQSASVVLVLSWIKLALCKFETWHHNFLSHYPPCFQYKSTPNKLCPSKKSFSKCGFPPVLGEKNGVISSMRLQVIQDSLFSLLCSRPILWAGQGGVPEQDQENMELISLHHSVNVLFRSRVSSSLARIEFFKASTYPVQLSLVDCLLCKIFCVTA